MLLTGYLTGYKTAIRNLPADRPLTKMNLWTDNFRMERSGELEIYYAPHNEYLNPSAQVAIVGITPGWTQMKLAYEAARLALSEGDPDEEVCRRSKEAAGLAGSMRVNLIRMLDALGLHRSLRLASCADLFGRHRRLLHTTSLLRFPVFVGGRNYTGSRPALGTTGFLRDRALADVREELRRLGRPLIIPLGTTVENVLRVLEREGSVETGQVLRGFPHPSGANGHRHRQFCGNFEQMRKIILRLDAAPSS